MCLALGTYRVGVANKHSTFSRLGGDKVRTLRWDVLKKDIK